MKKLYFVMALLIVASMILTACGTPATQAAPAATEAPAATQAPAATEAPVAEVTAADCAKAEVFCVGLVTDVGRIDDKSFNEASWTALNQAKDEGLVQYVDYIVTTDSKDYGKNMAVFGDEGFDVIVASGFNLGTATIEAANLYPDSKFIAVDMPAIAFTPAGETTPTNFTGLIFPEDQAGFLVGALASMMSKSHHIGGVFATDVVPAVWRFGEGYAAGAAYADTLMGTTTVVDKIYHNDVGFDKTFIDPEWAASAANSMIDQGADAIFGGGGSTGNGAVVAAAQRSVYAIGVDVDQYYTLPEAASYMLTSATKAIQPGVYDLIKAAVDGTFVGGGDNVAAIGYAPFHDLDSQVSADIKAKMEEIAKGLADGTIKTNVAPTKP